MLAVLFMASMTIMANTTIVSSLPGLRSHFSDVDGIDTVSYTHLDVYKRQLLDKYGEPCPDAMVESGLDHIKLLQDNDFHEYKISVKASDVFMAAAAYQQLAVATDAPIHLGITEAGGMISGTVKSAIGLGSLLWFGIGDTIRVSLSADPVEEVKVGFEILKSLGLRTRGVQILSLIHI